MLLHISSELLTGKSLTRILLNNRLRKEKLSGSVIDVGGGHSSDYLQFMEKDEDVVIRNFDVKDGAMIDFESDRLPANDGEYDTVLFLNVMEHIYNHHHIAKEVARIVSQKGQLIGFVPFLMWYHPDHSDYYRYTHEALEKIFKAAGGDQVQIEVVGKGPFFAAAQMTLQSFPKIIRPIVFFPLYILDYLYSSLKGKDARPYALGYYFTVTK